MTFGNPPEGILDPQVPWSRINPNSRLWVILKARLTGRPQGSENYSSYVNISEADADRLIANMKKDPRGYPSLDQTSGTPVQWMERQRIYQEWLVEEYLEKPFREQVDKKIEDAAVESRLNEIQEEKRKKQEEQKKQEQVPQVEVVEEIPPEEEEVEDSAELAAKVVDESYNDVNEKITEDILEDLPDSVKESLVNLINKRTGSNLTVEKKEKTGSVSNSRILKTLTSQFQKIQSQLSTIDSRLQEQNSLLRANLYTSLQNIGQLEYQDDVLSQKLDALLEAYQKQSDFAKEEADKAEDRLAESRLEQTKDAAFTEGFKDTSGGDSLLGRLLAKLAKFLGTKIFNRIWKLLPKGIRSRARLARRVLAPKNIKRAIGSRVSKFLTGRIASTAAKAGASAAPRAVAKGFEHIALPGVTRNIDDVGKIATSKAGREALTNMLGPVNKAAISQLTEPKSGFKVAMTALNNAKVRAAITKKGGQELLQKILAKAGIKVGGQAVPVVGQALNLGYGLIEGITRTAMGDPKGGLLSLGGAIPIAGAGFSVVDIIRDIDINAYTKHIEPNLGSIATGDGKPVMAFFNEVAGQELQYEQGGLTKPGEAILHGTEMILPNGENPYIQLMNPVAGALISASSKFINQAGPAAALVAPTFKQTANKLSEVFDVPTTLAQTNVGGSYSGIDTPIKTVKKKGDEEREEKSGDEVEITDKEQKIIDEANDKTGGFVDKLKRFFGIRVKEGEDKPTDYGDDVNAKDAMGKGHGSEGSKIAGALGNHMKSLRTKLPVTGEIHRHPDHPSWSQSGHSVNSLHYSGRALDIGGWSPSSPEGGGVDEQAPVIREILKWNKSNGYKPVELIHGSPAYKNVGSYRTYPDSHHHHVHIAYKDGGETPAVPTPAMVGEAGKEIVMKNLVATSPARDMLMAMNDAQTHLDVIESVKTYAPEILMYDTEEQQGNSSIIMLPIEQPSQPQMTVASGSIDPYKFAAEQKIPATKALILQSLYL